MKKQFILTLLLGSIFSSNVFAGTDADEVDISNLTTAQADMVQAELSVFSTIAYDKTNAKDEAKLQRELQSVIYCGYDAFANQQDQFLQITKSNEKMVFETKAQLDKYKHLAKAENKLPTNPAVCAKYHKSA
ncbi:hypothetical protein [Photobacterium leiognathi]|uniref:hypothetical protein n=1 Tax=Photobacterium leiognathi TaxID=553611 RepID=UPI00273904DA|nr:hypothetical protein [Photobacterium leiognathi]